MTDSWRQGQPKYGYALMSKTETIEAIRKLNPSARPDFLAEFSMTDLHDYLRQLEDLPEQEIDVETTDHALAD